MSTKDKKPVENAGELSEQQLDKIAGGQEVKKMGTIVVEAKRERPDQVVKMERIVVTAKREAQPATQVATADVGSKKN